MTTTNVSKFAQQVANDLANMLEAGGLPQWRKCWAAAVTNAPHNGASKKNYKGINALWLACKMYKEGWKDTRFYTFKQIQEAGGKVKKGSKGTGVEFWLWRSNTATVTDENGEETTVKLNIKPFSVKYYTVFNAEQCEGLPELVKTEQVQTWEPCQRAENILSASGVPFHFDEADRCYYRPSEDAIHLPPRAAFESQEAFYSTALHELTHATGHESRCKRSMLGTFGTASYAAEELRAEIGSVMLCSILGIQPADQNAQHAAYIKSWIKVLRDNPKEIFKAANDAEKAVQWILDREEAAGLAPVQA